MLFLSFPPSPSLLFPSPSSLWCFKVLSLKPTWVCLMNSIHQSLVCLIRVNPLCHASLPTPVCTGAADTPFERAHSYVFMFKQNKGLATHKSLGDWPLLVMMLLQCGACYCVMDCVSVPLALDRSVATCFASPNNRARVFLHTFLSLLWSRVVLFAVAMDRRLMTPADSKIHTAVLCSHYSPPCCPPSK